MTNIPKFSLANLKKTTALSQTKPPVLIGFAGSVQEMVTIRRWMQFCLDDLKAELDLAGGDKALGAKEKANAVLAYSFISSYLEVQMERLAESMSKPRKVS